MARATRIDEDAVAIASTPAMTPEDREDQLIALATNLAEQRLRDGTASNQLIAEIMRLGTTKERLQKEKLQRENEMLRAKTEAIMAQKSTDQLYKRALDAMRSYAGLTASDDFEDYDEYDEID